MPRFFFVFISDAERKSPHKPYCVLGMVAGEGVCLDGGGGDGGGVG